MCHKIERLFSKGARSLTNPFTLFNSAPEPIASLPEIAVQIETYANPGFCRKRMK